MCLVLEKLVQIELRKKCEMWRPKMCQNKIWMIVEDWFNIPCDKLSWLDALVRVQFTPK